MNKPIPQYSAFWLAGGVLTTDLWHAKDMQLIEDIDLEVWSKLSDAEHLALCKRLGFVPTLVRLSSHQRKQLLEVQL
jgi:ribonucleotide reductase beta subunit family protein with ferritin-like domain